ncbi:hypothetical protein FKM82_012895 [Ascaphus truei]
MKAVCCQFAVLPSGSYGAMGCCSLAALLQSLLINELTAVLMMVLVSLCKSNLQKHWPDQDQRPIGMLHIQTPTGTLFGIAVYFHVVDTLLQG